MPIELCNAANKFVPSIKCLCQPETSLLEEPLNIENTLVIPNTLQIRRLVREIGDGKVTISFLNISRDVDQVYVKDYKNILKCSYLQ